MNKRLDIILFGATGFTGKYCIRALHLLSKASGPEKQPITWGIAGRSEAHLKDALAYCQDKLGGDEHLLDIPVIIADANDYGSLKRMTASASCIVNCCGPFRFYGEAVIKACIETGTHHVDVSGETEFMELMQLKYDKLAKEKGVYVINSCGFDSMAMEMGVNFLEKNFEGTLNSVESFLQQHDDNSRTSNGIFNYGTWESAIHSFANEHELKKIRSKLNQKAAPPRLVPKLKQRPVNKKHETLDGFYTVPFPTCDRSVVLRSQQHLFDDRNKRPVQIKTYYSIEGRRGLFLLAFFGKVFQFLAKREYGRKLLLKFPDLFSNGYFTHAENLSEQRLDKLTFTLNLIGTGWDSNAEMLENDPHNFKDLPTKTMFATVKGSNPSYGVASAAAVLSAIIVLSECDKLPSRGGVYTPGAAFFDTSMIDQLQQNNVLSFNIKSKL